MEIQSRKVTVAKMTEEDVDWFVNVAAVNMLIEEVGRPDFVNVEQLYKLAHMGLEMESVFIARVDGKYAGAVCGILSDNFFNPNLKTLVEAFWYVLPEYRYTRAGLMLLNSFVEFGNEVADDTTMCLLTESPVKTLEKRGFVRTEQAFIRRNHKIFNEK